MPIDRLGTRGASLGGPRQGISGGSPSPKFISVYSPPTPAEADSQGESGDRHQRHWEDSFSQIEYTINVALFSGQRNPTADPQHIVRLAVEQGFGSTVNGAVHVDALAAAGADDRLQPSPNSAPSVSAATRAFASALRAHGVEPRKFYEDLATAVADAQRGHVDASRVFRNFPVGSSLDTVA